jgi:hypothetical protein
VSTVRGLGATRSQSRYGGEEKNIFPRQESNPSPRELISKYKAMLQNTLHLSSPLHPLTPVALGRSPTHRFIIVVFSVFPILLHYVVFSFCITFYLFFSTYSSSFPLLILFLQLLLSYLFFYSSSFPPPPLLKGTRSK